MENDGKLGNVALRTFSIEKAATLLNLAAPTVEVMAADGKLLRTATGGICGTSLLEYALQKRGMTQIPAHTFASALEAEGVPDMPGVFGMTNGRQFYVRATERALNRALNRAAEITQSAPYSHRQERGSVGDEDYWNRSRFMSRAETQEYLGASDEGLDAYVREGRLRESDRDGARIYRRAEVEEVARAIEEAEAMADREVPPSFAAPEADLRVQMIAAAGEAIGRALSAVLPHIMVSASPEVDRAQAPAYSSISGRLDFEGAEQLIAQCPSCDLGLPYGCACPDLRDVQNALNDALREIERERVVIDQLQEKGRSDQGLSQQVSHLKTRLNVVVEDLRVSQHRHNDLTEQIIKTRKERDEAQARIRELEDECGAALAAQQGTQTRYEELTRTALDLREQIQKMRLGAVHDIDSGGNCRVPGCRWNSDTNRVHNNGQNCFVKKPDEEIWCHLDAGHSDEGIQHRGDRHLSGGGVEDVHW